MEKIKGYEVILIENKDKLKLFINELNNFKGKYVSIDFEYTKNKIHLWQVCFYNNDKTENNIYVLQARIIDNLNMDIIIDKLLTSKIIKIFHGAESLDFPYLFTVLKKPELIYKFLKNTFDTRFLCEYYKKTEKTQNNLCNVYDAMKDFGALKEEKYNELKKVNKQMGPIWLVNWDKVSSNKNLLIYTVYDVVYLKKLLLKVYKKYKELDLVNDFYDLQKINIYIMLKRNRINYNYKLKLKNDKEKYKLVEYYRGLL